MSNQSEKGLMSKTKKELVEIIFRKDDVERRLQVDKESAEKALENAKKDVRDLELKNHSLRDVENDLNAKLDDANNELISNRREINDLKTANQVLRSRINIRSKWRTFFVITTIILAATTIIFAIC